MALTTAPPAPAQTSPGPDDIQPVANETLDRTLTGLITLLPFLGFAVAVWQTWSGLLDWGDVIVFVTFYALTGIGVTVGFHRLFTHRSFKTGPRTRAVLAILGSAAIEGPVISWVADHRKHHAFSDVARRSALAPRRSRRRPARHAARPRPRPRRLAVHPHPARLARRYAPDLLADPIVAWVDRKFVLWVTLSLSAPFALGFAISGGEVSAGLTGMLWGGLIRMLVLHHVTYSINSLCHVFGRRRFNTKDHSRNLAWLSVLSLGEAWHNNHHAFPTSASHGMRRYELDPSALVIRLLERLGLAWDVVRISPERQATKLA